MVLDNYVYDNSLMFGGECGFTQEWLLTTGVSESDCGRSFPGQASVNVGNILVIWGSSVESS